MNIYEKLHCEEFQNQTKGYGKLCDITDRQIRDLEQILRLDPSHFSPIIADLLRSGKPSFKRVDHLTKQINYHLRHIDHG